MVSASLQNAKIILTLPRCGTHFIWSRLVQSGKYQLIYDADRIPALDVLGRKFDGKLHFLCPSPRNPNYNFQYNSLAGLDVPLAASGHLDRLRAKHSAADPYDLFRKLMELQDHGGRTLFSINRFIYTCANDHFSGQGFEWDIDCAMESLRLMHDWFGRLGHPADFVLVIRRLNDWVKSQMFRRGADKAEVVKRRLEGLPLLLKTCAELRIPVFYMDDVIDAINAGELDFERKAAPLDGEELASAGAQAAELISSLPEKVGAPAPKLFRVGRFVEYVREKDPIKRISLVRSIGYLPVRISDYIPIIGRKIQDDCDGVILNNARILE